MIENTRHDDAAQSGEGTSEGLPEEPPATYLEVDIGDQAAPASDSQEEPPADGGGG